MSKLNESPDLAKGPDGTELFFADPDAIVFGFIGGSNCVVARNTVHPEMLRNIRFAINHGPIGSSLVLRQEGIKTSSKFGQAEEDEFEDAVARSRGLAPVDRVRFVMSPCGRYWPGSGLISFWAKRSEVSTKQLDTIAKMVGVKPTDRVEFAGDYDAPYEEKATYEEVRNGSKKPSPKTSALRDWLQDVNWQRPVADVFSESIRSGRRFWGKDAAGVIVRRPDGKILMLKRSGSVMGGGWGVPGGRIDYGENAMSTVRQEAEEEMGGLPKGNFSGRKYVFKMPLMIGDEYDDDAEGIVSVEEDGKEQFTYTTLEYLTDEKDWEPKLNWEHEDFAWFDPKDALRLGSVTQRDANGKTLWPVRQMIASLYGGKHAI